MQQDQKQRLGLVVLVGAFVGIVVLALREGGGQVPSLAVLAVPVLVIGGFVALVWVRVALARRRLRAVADEPPFTATDWHGDHELVRPAVTELEFAGYATAAVGRSALGTPLVLLTHPDGSTAAVEVPLRRRRPVTFLVTCLVPGAHWLITHRGVAPQILAHTLVDAVPGRPGPGDPVERHRRSRDAVVDAGVGLVPVGPEGAVDDLTRRVTVPSGASGKLVVVAEHEPDRLVTDLTDWPERRALLVSLQAGWPAPARPSGSAS